MKRNRSCGRIAVKVQQVIDCLGAYVLNLFESYTDSWLSSAYKAMLAHLIAGLRVTICKKKQKKTHPPSTANMTRTRLLPRT